MLNRVLDNPTLRNAARALTPGAAVHLSGVWGSAAALVAAAVGRITGRCVLFITPHMDAADGVADDLEVFLRPGGTETAGTVQNASPRPGGKGGTVTDNVTVPIFPPWDVELGPSQRVAAVSAEVTGERLRLCNLLSQASELRDEPVQYIVAPVMALLQPVPTPAALAASRLELRKGTTLDPEALAAWLVEAGYDRVDQVDQQAEFARRGGIVDIFPPGSPYAIRVEFFGDEVESVRRFDLDSLRSSDQIAGYDLAGISWDAHHFSGSSNNDNGARATHAEEQKSGKRPNLLTTHLLDYLPGDAIICMLDPSEVLDVAAEIYDRVRSDEAAAHAPDALHHPDVLTAAMGRLCRLDMHPFRPRGGISWDAHDFSSIQQDEPSGQNEPCVDKSSSVLGKSGKRPNLFELGARSLQRLSTNVPEAMAELGQIAKAADLFVYCENAAEQKHFAQMLAAEHPDLAAKVHTGIGHVQTGFHWPAQRLAVVGHHEIFHRYAVRRRIAAVRTGRPIDSLLDLQTGDHVVHVAHGIAKFQGLQKLQRDGRAEEYLRLEFADKAVLHVPAAQINLVQKYIGSRGKKPTLSKLGGASWSRQKARVGEAVADLAAEMLRIQAMRAASPGVSYPAATEMQEQFAGEFIYTETEDQLTSMDDIHRDMAAPRPMDRLLCGDVGFGKTELAMRAAFKAVEAGKQVAVLVPTTVLADQHYNTFRERLADYPISVDVISRFRTGSEQNDIVKRLALRQIDILIGTHRLLSKDIRFADLGLVVIDEEQRFGVEHKDQLKSVRTTLDVLTMTATPIPRTLHMALLGLRDISSLSTAPMDRRAIHTEVCQYDENLIRFAITRELNRHGQVFFVHNRVQDIGPLAHRIGQLVPDARICIAHGQMSGAELEEAMLKFVRQEIDVLVCTTIIESGLDIPSANTIIIHNADRFGLSELHQLRGRVGRYKHRAYCYLLLPEHRSLSPVAAKRLKAIEDFSDLGAGFQIAMRDLEIRGAGNILGPQQSGHIAAVGYELYCQLLEQAVRQMRGESPPQPPTVHVELGVEALIPRSYIAADRQRMEVYRRMARCAEVAELEQLTRDLGDAYGRPPAAVEALLAAVEIRLHAQRLKIESIIRRDKDIVFTIRDMKVFQPAMKGAQGSVRVVDDHTVYWRPPPAYLEERSLLRALVRRLGGKKQILDPRS
ncbi:MAG: transcription-repair coupling factor [Planctomycetaceae bacterium]|nr:transcription-repair coupling factor [Planctomycetaceae bacterium]